MSRKWSEADMNYFREEFNSFDLDGDGRVSLSDQRMMEDIITILNEFIPVKFTNSTAVCSGPNVSFLILIDAQYL